MSRIYTDKWKGEEHTGYLEEKGKSTESEKLKITQSGNFLRM